MKTGDLFETPAVAADTARRIVPEGNRYRWEQQWLQENRRVSGVIHSDRQSFDSTESAPQSAQSTMAAQSAAELPAMAAKPAIEVSQSNAGGGVAFAGMSEPAAATNKPASAFSAFDTNVPRRDALSRGAVDKAAQPRVENSNSALARYKSEQKNFALWRSDDEIKISMRLSQSQPEQAATLGVLRQWLKDLRLKLTSLIVNGHERSQGQPKVRGER